jgi:hypothetical protein
MSKSPSEHLSDHLSDQRFLAIRSLLVELAASLDRVERHAGGDPEGLESDRRWQLLKAAVDRIAAGGGRAEAVQQLFSDPYDAAWRHGDGPRFSGSPNCCGQ